MSKPRAILGIAKELDKDMGALWDKLFDATKEKPSVAAFRQALGKLEEAQTELRKVWPEA